MLAARAPRCRVRVGGCCWQRQPARGSARADAAPRRGLATSPAGASGTFAGLRELRSSSDLLTAPRAGRLLQERLAEEGYLLFRDLVDREQVLALRRRMGAEIPACRTAPAVASLVGDRSQRIAPKGN